MNSTIPKSILKRNYALGISGLPFYKRPYLRAIWGKWVGWDSLKFLLEFYFSWSGRSAKRLETPSYPKFIHGLVGVGRMRL